MLLIYKAVILVSYVYDFLKVFSIRAIVRSQSCVYKFQMF